MVRVKDCKNVSQSPFDPKILHRNAELWEIPIWGRGSITPSVPLKGEPPILHSNDKNITSLITGQSKAHQTEEYMRFEHTVSGDNLALGEIIHGIVDSG